MKLKNQSGKPEDLRQHNRYVILRQLTAESALSKSALAKLTGMALPSVMRITDILEEQGVIRTIGKGVSTGGRKPELVEINPEYKWLIGVELAMTAKVVLTDFRGQARFIWESEPLLACSPESVMTEILKAIEDAIAKHSLNMAQIAGIGIGTPGSNFKLLSQMPRAIIMGWESFDAAQWMRERIDLPVYVENVARTNALAELWFGEGKTRSEFLYVYLDRGVGAVLYKNSELQYGAQDASGEFGHMGIQMDGRPCYCGKKGCIEMYVSAGAILNRLEDFKGNKADLEETISRELGYGIANLINLYNPAAIILGGSVAQNYPDLMLMASERAREIIFNNRAQDTPIIRTAFTRMEGCIGSAALVQDIYFRSL